MKELKCIKNEENFEKILQNLHETLRNLRTYEKFAEFTDRIEICGICRQV